MTNPRDRERFESIPSDWKLTIPDNGGEKPDQSPHQKKADLAQVWSRLLAKQLDATVEVASDSQGTATTITRATFKSKPLKAA